MQKRSKIEKVNINIKFCILKKKEYSGWKKTEKSISGATSIRHSRIGTKFSLKMTLLNFWIKSTQKGISKLKKWKLPSNATYLN